jgi:hypothetical protein
MKSFNEFESTEETISIQEQRLALVEQSLNEKYKFVLDAIKKRASNLLLRGRGAVTTRAGYRQLRQSGKISKAQGQQMAAGRRFRQGAGRFVGGAAKTAGTGYLFAGGANLAQQMFGAKGAQMLKTLQSNMERQAELDTLSKNLSNRGSGRGKEPQGSKLGRTGISGLRDKRSS